jgi:hypothetical protein
VAPENSKQDQRILQDRSQQPEVGSEAYLAARPRKRTKDLKWYEAHEHLHPDFSLLLLFQRLRMNHIAMTRGMLKGVNKVEPVPESPRRHQ